MAAAFAPAMGVAGLCWAGIEGSKHDFSKMPWSGGDTCGVCHVPHRDEDPKAAPLWDENVDLSAIRHGTGTGGADNASQRGSAWSRGGDTSCPRWHDGTIAKSTIGVRASASSTTSIRDAPGTRPRTTPGIAYPQIDEDYIDSDGDCPDRCAAAGWAR
jgi:hypothetical protein